MIQTTKQIYIYTLADESAVSQMNTNDTFMVNPMS